MAINILSYLTMDIMTFVAVFFFVFATVFALMIKLEMFKETRSAVAAIAAVMGFATAGYAPVATVIMTILPIAAVILVVLFLYVFIREITKRKRDEGERNAWPYMMALAIMLILLAAFWKQLAGAIGFAAISADTVLWIIGIIFIVVILYGAYKEWGGGGEAPKAH